jgi:hypothetical protein
VRATIVLFIFHGCAITSTWLRRDRSEWISGHFSTTTKAIGLITPASSPICHEKFLPRAKLSFVAKGILSLAFLWLRGQVCRSQRTHHSKKCFVANNASACCQHIKIKPQRTPKWK